jgi:periplasmic divalent cation tolerance protein
MSIIAIMTTTGSLDEARSIAAALVERKLVACAQISSIHSYNRWEGAVQNDDEFRLLLKTTEDRYPEVEAAILELHSYDLPAIVAFDITKGYGPYADWVSDNASGERNLQWPVIPGTGSSLRASSCSTNKAYRERRSTT